MDAWLRGPARQPYAEWIADRIAGAVAAGELQPDDRLPPQREVAGKLGLDLTTVTRGYREAQARGLIAGQVGRGTYVRGRAKQRTINLTMNLPPPLPPALAREALQLAANVTRARTNALMDYTAMPHRALETAVEWLRRCRLQAERERIVITSGAQHALSTIAAVLRHEHPVVLVEEFTYSIFRDVAALFGLRLVPVPLDREGIVPAALIRQARKHRATAVYLTPTMQNPTGVTMSEGRRDEVAQAILGAKLLLIEDDVYGVVLPKVFTPIAARIPERSIFVTSLSKSVAPGVRIGYIVAPRELVPRLHEALRTMIYTTSPIGALVAAAWIETGLADRIVATRRESLQRRHRIARAALEPAFEVSPALSYHLWLRIPVPEAEFVNAALARGLAVNPGSAFGDGPPAIRVCIAAADDVDELRDALAILREVLASGEAETAL